jgi:hypothetical protein
VQVNLSADAKSRQQLLKSHDLHVADGLVTVLRKSSLRDLPLSCLLCQVLFFVRSTLKGTLMGYIKCVGVPQSNARRS